MSFFYRIMSWFRTIGSFLVPVAGAVRPGWGFVRVLGWILHILLFIGMIFLLRWINTDEDLRMRLRGHSPFVQRNWLPILFVLVYILGWLAVWLYKLLFVESDTPDFPDITSAWEAAMSDLARQNIDLTTLPIFLVLGRPDSSIDALFQSSGLKYVVRRSPHEDAPLSVYATSEAIYLTCVGCSITGEYCSQLAGAASTSGGDEYVDSVAGGDTIGGKTGNPWGNEEDEKVQHIIRAATQQGRELTGAEKREIRRFARQDRSYQSCVRNADEVARLTARFEAFCSLIVRDRWPYCPINGILLIVPLAATDTEQDALDAGSAAQYDLSTAQRVLQVNCAAIAMVSDLEASPGFEEFVRNFSEKQREQRIGQRCPKVPHLDAGPNRSEHATSARGEMLESLAAWVGNAVTAGWVFKLFQIDNPAKGDDFRTITQMNSNLFLFLNDMRERHGRLGKVLSHAMLDRNREPIFFGGCYICATGHDRELSQSFVKGVFRRMTDEEDFVTWTEEALAEEAGYQSNAGIAQIVLGILVLITVGLAGFYFFGNKL